MRRLLVFVLAVFTLSGVSGLKAQRVYFFTEQWSVGLGVGASTFYGDLTDKTNRFFSNTPFSKYFYQDRQARAVFILEKKINIYFGVRGHLSYGNIKSTKESDKQWFKAHLFEYSLSGVIDFTNIFGGFSRYRAWSVYGHVGIGFTESRTWKYDMNTGALIGTNGFGQPKRDGGKYVPMTETVMPIGLGFKYQFSKAFLMNIEMELHPIHTDKLDATISEDSWWEGYGLIWMGMTYNFSLPDHWQLGNRNPRYNGKSTDPAIKAFNKRKHTIMKTKSYKRSLKRKPKRRRHKLKLRRR